MQIVPVVDLKGGQVVRGIGGNRSSYRPIVSSLTDCAEPSAIAHALAANFSPAAIYVADLDAIETGEPDVACWRAIADAGVELWLDAGVGSIQSARFVCEALRRIGSGGSAVIGLESIPSLGSLNELRPAAGDRPVFSLDLREGRPLARNPADRSFSPFDWAVAAVRAGFERLIVLDLADVGTGRGSQSLELCRTLRAELPRIELISGGGVRHLGDLQDLATAGCSAALVASALHDGRISPDDCNALSS